MTKEDLLQARKPIPQLFAYGIDSLCHKVSTEESGFTYKSGIPSTYSSITGKKVCRGDINGLFRATTQSKWFNQLGGYYTYSDEVSEMIGGYPLGAVLYYKDPSKGKIRTVRSLIADNTFNFVENPDYINNVYWEYVDNVVPVNFRPRIFPEFPEVESEEIGINETLEVNYPCLFMIQAGCDTTDTTDGESDFYLYLTVKPRDKQEFYTAGLLAYIPTNSKQASEGVIMVENSSITPITDNTFTAWNCPYPIQIYLSGGDTVKVTGNIDFPAIKDEKYKYWIFRLRH